MTTEHKTRASEGSSTKSHAISAHNFPCPRSTPRPGFNPKTSPILAALSDHVLTTSNRFWTKNRSYRKQTIKPLLAGSRFAYKLFEIRQVSTQNLAPERLPKKPKFSDSRAFLPGSAQNIECDVTYSKQSTGEFLPGAPTASRAHSKSSNLHTKLSEEIAWLLQ